MGIVPGHDWWRWLLAQGAPRRASLLETCAVPAQEPPKLHANLALVLCLVASAASASRAWCWPYSRFTGVGTARPAMRASVQVCAFSIWCVLEGRCVCLFMYMCTCTCRDR